MKNNFSLIEENNNGRILVIVRDVRVNDYIKLVLRGSGYMPISWTKVSEIEADFSTQNPSLILLDLFFPGLDSINFLKQIRANEDLCRVRVVIISSLGFSEVVNYAVQSGANDFIMKPFGADLLLEKVRKNLPEIS